MREDPEDMLADARTTLARILDDAIRDNREASYLYGALAVLFVLLDIFVGGHVGWIGFALAVAFFALAIHAELLRRKLLKARKNL